jgi:hypothetical protein
VLPRAERFLCAAAALSYGCGATGTPRLQDAPAPRDFLAQVHDKEAPCDHEVVVFRPGAPIARPYKEVGSLSATCSPGAADICERRLRERACALGADGLVLLEPTAGPNPAGASNQSLISRDGRAIRWER